MSDGTALLRSILTDPADDPDPGDRMSDERTTMSDLPDIWIFDENRRVYPKDASGRTPFGGSPIWREHWVKVEVIGETRVSWVVQWYGELKVPKKGANPARFAFSLEDIERRTFVVENRHGIADAVGRLGDFDKLKAVAELVGYAPDAKLPPVPGPT
jgi:hypothetical protein